ncbi:MAG: hypothetical protein JSU03_08910 [Bacteroidetes bacterium]|nr:hypothetical protein [Bacteroidota bacterium]MBS1757383.1 hypothetical protein [Bacteroidota bacterium]
MKTSTEGIIAPLNKEEMNELLKETKETLATGSFKNTNAYSFAEVNMWKVRKAARHATEIRRRFI